MSLAQARRRVTLARRKLRCRQLEARLTAARLDSIWQRWRWPLLLTAVGVAGFQAAASTSGSEDGECREGQQAPRKSGLLAWSSLLTQLAPLMLPLIEAHLAEAHAELPGQDDAPDEVNGE